MKTNNRAYLESLLQERNEHPERMAEIDAKINETFRQNYAILVMDMSGFSRTTVRYGIIHFLAMIHRMHGIVKPIISECGGTVVKEEADNIFAVFPDVKSAVEAAIDSLKETGGCQHDIATGDGYLPLHWYWLRRCFDAGRRGYVRIGI
jgi:adenylate cyclase